MIEGECKVLNGIGEGVEWARGRFGVEEARCVLEGTLVSAELSCSKPWAITC